MKAASPGILPTAQTPFSGRTSLPSGRLRSVESPGSNTDSASRFWLSDEVVPPSLWADLALEFPNTGLWPILVYGQPTAAGELRPWETAEFSPENVDGIDEIDANEWLTVASDGLVVPDFDVALEGIDQAGFGTQGRCHHDLQELSGLASTGSRLVLVPVSRPADSITKLGWEGPINASDEMAPYSAVIRLWEDRFGALVMSLGFNTLELAFQSPPEDQANAIQLANELGVICPDLLDQDLGSVEALSEQLLIDPIVRCWWD